MGHQRVGGTLLSLAQTFKRLDPSDPVTQCLAPRLSRKFATHTDLPIVARPTYKPTPINPNVDPSLYSPPKLLTTLHSWPELEPVRYAWYGSQYLDVPLRRDLLHRAVIYEADGTRMGTAFARHRTDIPGSNRKVLPQKGTGRARAGDSKSPIRKGGGVAHGPKPRDFSTELPRKIYDRAWRTALSYRYRKGELMVLDGHIDISDHQTARFLYNFFTKSKTNQSLLVAGKVRKHLSEAMGQVGKFGKIKDIEDVDVKDMLSSARIVIEQKALNALLLAHSSDLGYDCSLGLAVKFANTELPGAFFRANVGDIAHMNSPYSTMYEESIETAVLVLLRIRKFFRRSSPASSEILDYLAACRLGTLHCNEQPNIVVCGVPGSREALRLLERAMAIQKKHGKGRLDKWYKLAKEKGYRARAAFKLIQLNKKYGFLEKSHVLLDLCAAPGSWSQVAAETMPAQSLIIGVDLAPIKPIPRTIMFQGDITTDKCRATIRQHVKHMKADTVLHDGAPNVGVAWVQDAFSQAELVLQSMKLATEFLKEGGTFVTKVFRSKDYNALLWVFKQLFTFVEATKPPSSRNVSAEIFVVCRGFKAPKKLDPKFLDPKHVFAEVEQINPNNEAKVFNPEKKKRKREGYEEGEYIQHKSVPVSEFIQTTDPIKILGEINTLSFEQSGNGDLALAAVDRMPETTAEIRQCCKDLKVLGKKEFRTLLKWRMKIRDKFGMSAKAKKEEKEVEAAKEGEEVAEVESMDEELQIQEEMQRLKELKDKSKRKERRKENEQKQKEIVRMQMHMTAPFDIGMEQVGPGGEGAVFNLKTAERAQDSGKIEARDMDESGSDSEDSQPDSESDNESDEAEDRLEQELDDMYADYQSRREDYDAKLRAKRARKEKNTDDWEGLSDDGQEDASDSEEEEEETMQMKRPTRTDGLSSKAAMFFDQDIFQGLGVDELNDDNDDNDSAIELEDDSDEKKMAASATAGDSKSSKSNQAAPKQSKVQNDDWSDDEVIQTASNGRPEDPLKPNGQLDIDIITAEAMTLAQSLASGEKKSSDLVDDSFNRFSFRDLDGLPEWFLDDEGQHSKLQRPVTKAAAAAIKEKLRALNARPIKKVREAQGRKKFKAAQRLEKLKKKSALLAEDEGLSERDKANSIAKMMSKAAKKKPKQQVKLVVAKGTNRGISGRPRGVKGKYKIVDPRLKKDVRAEKRLKKKSKK